MKGTGRPFIRAQVMALAIAALMREPGMSMPVVMNKIGAYKSRGKGQGKMFVKTRNGGHGNNARRGVPHQNVREMTRRRRQFFGAGA